jgi:hypothetical protein
MMMEDDELHGLLMLAKIADLTGEARDADKLRQALNPKRVIILVEMARHKKDSEESLRKIRAGHTKTVEYDLSPAMVESALRDKLVELGWTPPPGPGYAEGDLTAPDIVMAWDRFPMQEVGYIAFAREIERLVRAKIEAAPK